MQLSGHSVPIQHCLLLPGSSSHSTFVLQSTQNQKECQFKLFDVFVKYSSFNLHLKAISAIVLEVLFLSNPVHLRLGRIKDLGT